MHLAAGETERIDDGGSAVDLGQSPGDIVILSSADSELAAFAAAVARADSGPSVRLANLMQLSHPYSVDLYVETTLSRAKIVLVRMMGGAGYWPYGLEALRALSRAGGPKLVVVPGEDRWDPALEPYSSLPIEATRRFWRACVEAGPANISRALALAAHWIGAGEAPDEAEPIPVAGYWRPEVGVVGRDAAIAAAGEGPSALLVFYRALLEGGSMEPVDALMAALAERGIGAIAMFVTSLKNEVVAAEITTLTDERSPAIVLNGTAFAISRAGREHVPTVLDRPGRPVLQLVFAGTSRAAWAESTRGLSPRDLIMNVVLPEVDGRILTRPVSFKEEVPRDQRTDSRIVAYRADRERIGFVADLASAWVRLDATPIAERRIALVLSNYPDRDGRLANGVGLDTPESAARIAMAMRAAGYRGDGFPEDGRALMDVLLSVAEREGFEPVLPLAAYVDFLETLPVALREALVARWGEPEADPAFRDGGFRLRIHRFANLVVAIQPARGYGIDPKSTYHDPALVPPHHYVAFHAWLRREFGAQAIVHVGKHGNLEWLPGKALGLSAECWPEAMLGPTPLVYPFIVNDPGEGAQAKRRSSAVIVDHLMPAMTRAGAHGPFAEIETLIDEYHLAAADPRRRDHLEREILSTATRHGIDRDLNIGRAASPDALRMIDAHLCDIKELQIREGLHILGESPDGDRRIDTLVAIARVPRSGGRAEDGSLHRALAADLGFSEFDPLACDLAADWAGPRPAALDGLVVSPWRTNGDTVERIEALAKEMVGTLVGGGDGAASLLPPPYGERRGGGTGEFSPDGVRGHPPLQLSPARGERVPPRPGTDVSPDEPYEGTGSERAWPEPGPHAAPSLRWILTELAPALDRSGGDEIAAVLRALDGRFVPPGPSGAPSRGRADVLPTGRNFYAVDTRAVPTEAAWRLGRLAAEALVARYLQDEGEWPRSVAISAWGTANMRTGGDDIAQVLALIGAEPVWEPGTGRVTGFRVLALSELKRPRVDVTLRISGMFRDAFPEQIDLIDSAIRAIAARDEPADANPIATSRGKGDALFRIFGARPGSYGSGMQALLDSGVWDDASELGDAFLEASGFAYGAGAEGLPAGEALRARLAEADAVLQNQDNREHDILDSDEYYQFQGGLALAVERLKGRAPRLYHGDHSRPETPVVRPLAEEIGRIVRGRATHPKWIAGCMRHGYKGAVEMAATLDFLFGYAATTHAVGDHHFDALYDAYLGDERVRDFIADANPPLLAEMAARFREAIDRALWSPRRNSVHERLAGLAAEKARETT